LFDHPALRHRASYEGKRAGIIEVGQNSCQSTARSVKSHPHIVKRLKSASVPNDCRTISSWFQGKC